MTSDYEDDISALMPCCFELSAIKESNSFNLCYLNRTVPFTPHALSNFHTEFDDNLKLIWDSNEPAFSDSFEVGKKNILTNRKLKILTPENQFLNINMGDKIIVHNGIRFSPTQLENHKKSLRQRIETGSASSTHCIMCNKEPCEVYESDNGNMGIVKDMARRNVQDYDVAMDMLKRTGLELLNAEPQEVAQMDGTFTEKYYAPKCLVHYIDYLLSQVGPRRIPAILERPATTKTACAHCYHEPCFLFQPIGKDILATASVNFMQGKPQESIRHNLFRAFSDLLDLQGGLFIGHPMPLCIFNYVVAKYPIAQEDYVNKRIQSRFIESINLVPKEGSALNVGYDFRNNVECALSNIHSSGMNVRQAFVLQSAKQCFCVICRENPCIAFSCIGDHFIGRLDAFRESTPEFTPYMRLKNQLYFLSKNQQSLQAWQKKNGVKKTIVPACFSQWLDAYYLMKMQKATGIAAAY